MIHVNRETRDSVTRSTTLNCVVHVDGELKVRVRTRAKEDKKRAWNAVVKRTDGSDVQVRGLLVRDDS